MIDFGGNLAALTSQDLANLQQYADAGDRYNYWKLLAVRGDRYGALALGVTTNETRECFRKCPGVPRIFCDLLFRTLPRSGAELENRLFRVNHPSAGHGAPIRLALVRGKSPAN